MSQTFEFWIYLGVTFGAITLTGAFWGLFFSEKVVSRRILMKEAEQSVTFIFDNENLVDASTRAKAMFARHLNEKDSDFECFLKLFSPTFPRLRTSLETLAEERTKVIQSPLHPDTILIAEYWNGVARLTYSSGPKQDHRNIHEPLELEAIEAEIQALRAIAETSPQPIWEEEDGVITWANAAYLRLANDLGHPKHAWPPIRIFNELTVPSSVEPNIRERVAAYKVESTSCRWFDVTSAIREDRCMRFATDIDPLVQAEQSQKNFVHTLSRIFAELSVGLAVFDKNRQLMIFNPALSDLTGLSFNFLSSQPDIQALLDRLRENRIFPEPRNYRSWRETVSHLETSAIDGTYCENWDLPDGRIFRVTGRPHPNGAIAFIWEDVSSEIASSRKFREKIETAQTVLDQLPEAVAVFDQSGELNLTNAAYRRLWYGEPDYFVDRESIFESVRHWQSKCEENPHWNLVRDAIFQTSATNFDPVQIKLQTGRRLECRITLLKNGKSMVKFRSKLRDTPRPDWIEPSPSQHLRA